MAAQTATKTRTHDDYTVGWVCALSKEQTAATAMLDERHDDLLKPPNDPNTYTLGSIGKHNIVIACLPQDEIGTSSAATFATWMISTFPSIKFGLMVGIGGGIAPKVRLGDVVVSTPTSQYPGVVQWDYGKVEKGGEFKQIGSLNNPPALLLTALTKLMTENEMSGSKMPEYLDELRQKWPRLVSKYTWSESLKDPLHTPAADGREKKPRETRVHYGLIASGNQVIKDAEFRDGLDRRYGGNVLCVEMEAAGLMNNFPCIVIRGICDYADSQKNNDWQEYAAAVAAAFAKELLHYIQPRDVNGERPVREIIREVHNDVTRIKAKLDGKDDIEILNWLTRTDYGPQQSNYFNKRQPETGTWFLESEEFQNWLATGKQMLFCPGNPGAGKTILTSIVVDYLCSKFYNNSKIGIAYIYCSFRMRDKQNINELLASVLKQLAEGQSCLPESIKDLYNRHKFIQTRPSTNEILTVLQSVTLLYSRVFIVVDALDECQESSGCRARFISELLNQKNNGANVFATSRLTPDIRDQLKGSKEVEIRAHDEDVRKYLESQIIQLGSAFLKTHCERVITDITKVAQGMFLLAQLYFEIIKTKKTLKKLGNILANVPTGQKAYDFAYEEAVRRIQGLDSDSKELAWLVLSWITCAKRPLTAKELQHALAVEIGKTELDEENLVEIEDMISVCAGLVTIDEEGGIIWLVHYTAQEYFERTQNRWFPTAQTDITTICVTYLSFSAFETGLCKRGEEFEGRLQLFPLYSYATRNWGRHAPKDEASQEVTNFLKSPAKVAASGQVLLDMNSFFLGRVSPTKMTGLHMAAFFGLNKATETLLDLGHSPNEEDAWKRRPLWYAARNGHVALVKLLLARGAIVNITDDAEESPLFTAAKNGHQEVVEELLAVGADVNALPGFLGKNALVEAVRNGHQQVVEKLLAAGADVETLTGLSKKNALVEAVRNGDQEIVEKLLAAGADVNAVATLRQETALVLAVAIDHQGIVEKLLAAGANVNAVTGIHYKTALREAVTHGHLEMIEKLLTAGADVNARTGIICAETALVEAARNGHQQVIEKLLAAGADVNAHTDFIATRTALTEAARNGHQETVEKLLTAGANVDFMDYEGRTALKVAAESGYQGIVEKLLAAGADAGFIDREGQTALMRAVENGSRDC
ncbi:ankyrin repeat-containing domain protein [Trichoderma pleuroticola]